MTRRHLLSLMLLVGLPVLPVLFLLVPGCAKHGDVWEGKGGPPRVVVSFAPLYSFVKSVGGDHVGVVCLATDTGPHEYKYNARDNISVRNADLLLALGLGLDEKYTDSLSRSSANSKLHFVILGKKLPKALLKKEEHKNEYDPHVWLGIPQAIELVGLIRDELKAVDPDKGHAADYDHNAAAYIKELKELHAQGKKDLADKKDKRLISFHESLNYFADSFGLTIVDVIEVGPGVEPTGDWMKHLVDECVAKDIKYIAVEPQYPTGSSAKTLLKELDKKKKDFKVEMIEIDPLETADPDKLSAELYMETMKANLKTLAETLK